MKTTVNLDEDLLRQTMSLYGVSTKTKILELGLRELLKAHRRRRLREAFGSQPDLARVRRRRPL